MEIRVPMVINVLENCYKNICICGNDSEIRRTLYNYLYSNKEINVFVEDEVSEKHIFLPEIECIIFTYKNHPMPFYENGDEVCFVDCTQIAEKMIKLSDILSDGTLWEAQTAR